MFYSNAIIWTKTLPCHCMTYDMFLMCCIMKSVEMEIEKA